MPWNPLENLSDAQIEKLRVYEKLILRYNRKINLVSRTSTEAFWEDHVTHSLALTYRSFPEGCTVVDWGTGGGLPAIPLAITFPEVEFYAVDAVEKKVQAVRSFVRQLNLENVFAWHGRAEEWGGRADYSVSRATAPLVTLWSWHARVWTGFSPPDESAWPAGLLCLKGGDLSAETAELAAAHPTTSLRSCSLKPLLASESFATKELLIVTEDG